MKIELYNDVTKQSIVVLATKRDIDVLERVQYAGGFYRFGISIISDEKGRNKKEIIKFLSEVFVNASVIEELF